MDRKIPPAYRLSREVARALSLGLPLVALESTVITHGLPYPENLTVAREMESALRQQGVAPATIAVLDGKIQVGVTEEQLERLANGQDMRKISARDLAVAIARKGCGGTTVAGTLLAAFAAGIRVFATGGIGGVHRQPAFDVSADIPQLARTPVMVVCAGAKAILDLPATLEFLETYSVPVVGYQTDEFPAFYSRGSGLKTSCRADTPQEVVEIARAHWGLGNTSAVLVVTPPPEEVALPVELVEEAVHRALGEAQEKGIRGQEVTPFLLKRVNEITGGRSLRANLGLLRNNAHLAGEIAHQFSQGLRKYQV